MKPKTIFSLVFFYTVSVKEMELQCDIKTQNIYQTYIGTIVTDDHDVIFKLSSLVIIKNRSLI